MKTEIANRTNHSQNESSSAFNMCTAETHWFYSLFFCRDVYHCILFIRRPMGVSSTLGTLTSGLIFIKTSILVFVI